MPPRPIASWYPGIPTVCWTMKISAPQITAPKMLKIRYDAETRFAFVPAPMPPMRTVRHLPIFCPMMIGAAVAKVIAPVAESACRIPTEGQEQFLECRGLTQREEDFLHLGHAVEEAAEADHDTGDAADLLFLHEEADESADTDEHRCEGRRL